MTHSKTFPVGDEDMTRGVAKKQPNMSATATIALDQIYLMVIIVRTVQHTSMAKFARQSNGRLAQRIKKKKRKEEES